MAIDWSKEFSYRGSGGSGDGSGVIVDSALSTTSRNPVQNKVITGELNGIKSDLSALNVTLTQAEYDALSEEEKNNGSYYFIVEE